MTRRIKRSVRLASGIGRLAKEMIDAYGRHVIGADISASMRRLAVDYVSSDRFVVVDPAQLTWLCEKGLRADMAISVWVLQHCLTPAEDIVRIHDALRTCGRLFVANMAKRAIPAPRNGTSGLTWVSDGLDVWSLLETAFAPHNAGILDPARCPGPTEAAEASWRPLTQRLCASRAAPRPGTFLTGARAKATEPPAAA